MGNLFSWAFSTSGGGVRTNERDKDLFKLKLQRDKLKTYIKKLESEILSETQLAKEHLRKDSKKLACYSLLRRKYRQRLLYQALEQENNLETVISQIEHSVLQISVFKALKKAVSVIKEINQNLTVDDVDKIRQETREAIEHQEQIDARLRSMNIVNDKEIEDELGLLLKEVKVETSSGIIDREPLEEVSTLSINDIEFPEPPKNIIEPMEEISETKPILS